VICSSARLGSEYINDRDYRVFICSEQKEKRHSFIHSFNSIERAGGRGHAIYNIKKFEKDLYNYKRPT
jgi:hypothetical protein